MSDTMIGRKVLQPLSESEFEADTFDSVSSQAGPIRPSLEVLRYKQIFSDNAADVQASLDRREKQFNMAYSAAVEIARQESAAGEACPLNPAIAKYFVIMLSPIIVGSDVDAPLILPLRDGGISAEWHQKGLNIEIRFRDITKVYVVVEDAENPENFFRGKDPLLEHAWKAIALLAHRGMREKMALSYPNVDASRL